MLGSGIIQMDIQWQNSMLQPCSRETINQECDSCNKADHNNVKWHLEREAKLLYIPLYGTLKITDK